MHGDGEECAQEAARQGPVRTAAHEDDYTESTAQNPNSKGSQQEHAGDAELGRHLKVVVVAVVQGVGGGYGLEPVHAAFVRAEAAAGPAVGRDRLERIGP